MKALRRPWAPASLPVRGITVFGRSFQQSKSSPRHRQPSSKLHVEAAWKALPPARREVFLARARANQKKRRLARSQVAQAHMGAYALYVRETFPKVFSRSGRQRFHLTSKLVCRRWKLLSPALRHRYEIRAKARRVIGERRLVQAAQFFSSESSSSSSSSDSDTSSSDEEDF